MSAMPSTIILISILLNLVFPSSTSSPLSGGSVSAVWDGLKGGSEMKWGGKCSGNPCARRLSTGAAAAATSEADTGYGGTTPSQSPGKNNSLKVLRIALGVCGGALGIAVVIGVVVFIFYRLRRKGGYYNPTKPPARHPNPHSDSSAALNLDHSDNYPGVNLFSYDELERATGYFSPSKELGRGGFGIVYYGKLGDGREVAIKRLYEHSNKQVGQFMNEIDILTRLRHPNLVTLYGSTSRHSQELLLVYDYIPNATVSHHLHASAKGPPLPWPTRLTIALETANALLYLHASDIIHRDVKTTNILLDASFSVKVADFGLSRLFPLDVTHVSTAPQGTPGYVDPEYHHCYHLTDKSDVYSFGVVLAELISSLPAVDITRRRHEINLSSLAFNRIRDGKIHELVDPALGGFDQLGGRVKQQVGLVAELAFRCLQQSREMRPAMEEVVQLLSRIQNSGDAAVVEHEVVDIPVDEAFMMKGDFSPGSSPLDASKEKSDSSGGSGPPISSQSS